MTSANESLFTVDVEQRVVVLSLESNPLYLLTLRALLRQSWKIGAPNLSVAKTALLMYVRATSQGIARLLAENVAHSSNPHGGLVSTPLHCSGCTSAIHRFIYSLQV